MKIRFFSKNATRAKKQEIWSGIVHKTESNGDYSLSQIYFRSISSSRKQYARIAVVAALFIAVVGTAILLQRNSRVLNDKDISTIYADTSSTSILVLASGDTILLDRDANRNPFVEMDGNQMVLAFNDKSFEDGVNVIESGQGRQLNVILPDGTKVWLNASSAIKFPSRFLGGTRDVEIQGEVYFEVVSNLSKPFIVHFGNDEVKVLGTHFNIRNYENENKNTVTLLVGSVLVTNKSNPSITNLLKPSQQLAIYPDDRKSELEEVANPYGIIAWKDGDFYFEEANIDYIIRELERWYPVNISVVGVSNSKKITGRIKKSDSLAKVVEMLRFFDIELLIEKRIQ